VHDELRTQVFNANLELAARGLAWGSFGNVSGIDREAGVVAIKPSGVAYSELHVEDLTLITLDGEPLAGLRPSSDAPTHLELYRSLDTIGGIAHTHSTYATVWAQARLPIPCLGTTHADYVNGPIPCTRDLTDEECRTDYERFTGEVIVHALEGRDPLEVPATLVASHGAFSWGTSASQAAAHAEALEQIARLAFASVTLDAEVRPIAEALHERHFRRKHGPAAYYGQR
jgi:L-ribulose-5-phosphate 4-epimerase